MGHTSFQLSRRAFLRAGLSSAGALALGPAFFERAFAAGPVTVGPGPYGPLQDYDANGIALPAGFESREIARGGSPVPGTAYTWHPATDGQSTFPTITAGQPDGGWILVANSEVPGAGGVSAVEFAADGDIERANKILAGTSSNCAGGRTPWGTWLSCEEYWGGRVHETDPTALVPGSPATTARPALGVFSHEAVCVDTVNNRLYLTEDKGDGCLYRFTPSGAPNDLSAGTLQVAKGPVDADGRAVPGTLTWEDVPDPSAGGQGPGDEMVDPTRYQVAGASEFRGGEGIWYDEGVVYFTTKGDGRVWTYTIAGSQLDVLYDPTAVGPEAPLQGVDNITVSPSGDVYVCEDGADHDICLITPEFEITRFLKLDPVKHAGAPEENPVGDNETVGVVFSPDGTRMYFGAQRTCFDPAGQIPSGVVYEVTAAPGHPGFRQTVGGGGNGVGGGTAVPTADSRAPGMQLTAKRHRLIRKFLDRGLAITLELDELAGVDATLKIGRRLLGRATPSVAVRDTVALSLTPSRNAADLLDGQDEVLARLKVVATDLAGNQTVLRRRVRLIG